eukprot:4447696-Pyramimonas_sp.AAC.1
MECRQPARAPDLQGQARPAGRGRARWRPGGARGVVGLAPCRRSWRAIDEVEKVSSFRSEWPTGVHVRDSWYQTEAHNLPKCLNKKDYYLVSSFCRSQPNAGGVIASYQLPRWGSEEAAQLFGGARPAAELRELVPGRALKIRIFSPHS